MGLAPDQVVSVPCGAGLKAQEFLIPNPVLFPVGLTPCYMSSRHPLNLSQNKFGNQTSTV